MTSRISPSRVGVPTVSDSTMIRSPFFPVMVSSSSLLPPICSADGPARPTGSSPGHGRADRAGHLHDGCGPPEVWGPDLPGQDRVDGYLHGLGRSLLAQVQPGGLRDLRTDPVARY